MTAIPLLNVSSSVPELSTQQNITESSPAISAMPEHCSTGEPSASNQFPLNQYQSQQTQLRFLASRLHQQLQASSKFEHQASGIVMQSLSQPSSYTRQELVGGESRNPPPSLRQFIRGNARKSDSSGSFHPMQELAFSHATPPTHAESEVTLAEELMLPPPSLSIPAPVHPPPSLHSNSTSHLFRTAQESPLTGPRVGEYVLTDTIGEGTFGKVKLGIHCRSGEKVAVKAIQKCKIKTVKQMNSVQREVRLMKLLKHPHIVDVRDTLEDDNQIFLVMEYASGGELFDYIAQQCQQDENMARVYFRQVVSAINYCHQNSIIHRDLKPENLLLDKTGNIKIIDFGFGNTFHRDRTLDTYCGSPYYAAPEMVKGIPYTGPEVDIWSLGVILYALITGNLPFDSRDMSILYALIAKGEYEPIKTSDTANDLVSIMLTVNPTKRAKMVQVIDHPWTNYGYTEKIVSHIVPRAPIVETPSKTAISELVSYGISEREIRRLLSIDCGLHPIKSLYFLVADYLARIERHKLRPGQSLTALQPLPRDEMPQHSSVPLLATLQSSQIQAPFRPTSAPASGNQQINPSFFMNLGSYHQQHLQNSPPPLSSAMASPCQVPQYNYLHLSSPHSLQFHPATNTSPIYRPQPRFESAPSMHTTSPPNVHYLGQQQPIHHPFPQHQIPVAQLQHQMSFSYSQPPTPQQLQLHSFLQMQRQQSQKQLFVAAPPSLQTTQSHSGLILQGQINAAYNAIHPQTLHQPQSVPSHPHFQLEHQPQSALPVPSETPLTLQQQVLFKPPGKRISQSKETTPPEDSTPATSPCASNPSPARSTASPGSRLFKALAAVGIRTASSRGKKKKSRTNGEDAPDSDTEGNVVDLGITQTAEPHGEPESDRDAVESQDMGRGGRCSVYVRPRRRLSSAEGSASASRSSLVHHENGGGRRDYNRVTDEGSENVWGMKWTSAHRPPAEEEEEPEEQDSPDISVKVTRASVATSSDTSCSATPRSGVPGIRPSGSLMHRLFGKK